MQRRRSPHGELNAQPASTKMFSGSESTESQNYTQWALNPAAYQNMQNEQVDWAALAHQWIKMKEAGPPIPTDKMIAAPPPPIISRPAGRRPHDGGGEAPMDVENDSDSNQHTDSNDSPVWSGNPNQSNSWGWSNTSWPPAIQTMPPSSKAPLLPTPGYNSYSTNKEDSFSANASSGGGGYWTGNGSPSNASSATSQQKLLKPHNKRFSKVNVPMVKTHHMHSGAPQPHSQTPPPIIDANKRKQLPAWIREGLEKMERDKMKQMDRTREREAMEDVEEKKRLRENAMEILKSTVRQNDIKAINDYDDSNDEEDVDSSGKSESVSAPVPPPAPKITPQAITPLTHEEMMLKVRRTMTEILLKVTNREIAQICKEELQRYVRKQKATDQHVTAPSAGANLSARLGLGVYAGSGESSDEDDEEPERNDVDSDNELREVIRRRKEEFARTEREIENRLAEAEKDAEVGKSRRETPERDASPSEHKAPDHERSRTPKPTASRPGGRARRSRSFTSTSSSSSGGRRSMRRDRHRSRSSSRSLNSRARRGPQRTSLPRRSPRSRSPRARRGDSSRRRSSRTYSPPPSPSSTRPRYRPGRWRRTMSRSPSPHYARHRQQQQRRRCTRSRSRSRSRSIDSGRGKRSRRH